MNRWRIAPAVLAAAGMLLAAAPGQAHAAERSGPGARTWVQETFPEGNADLHSAARVDGHTTWAVGSRTYGEGRASYIGPLILSREDGTARWSELPSPEEFHGIRTVTAGPAGTAWLTDSSPADGSVTTARHDDTGWRVAEAPLPEGSAGGGFTALAPVTDDDVWAVGWSQPGDFLTFLGLIEHWDGTRWERVPTPTVDSDYWTLNDVVAIDSDDVWATGSVGSPEGRIHPLMLHYDGDAWTIASTPELSSVYGEFQDLVIQGPNDVWAVGTTESGTPAKDHAAIAHYDGRGWTMVGAKAPAGTRLASATMTPSGIAAVGYAYVDDTYQPFVARQTPEGWKPSRIPAGDNALGRFPTVALSTGRNLTVIGLEPKEDPATGGALPPMPFSLTTG